MQYKTFVDEIDAVLSVSLKADATTGDKYAVRTIAIRLWDMIFGTKKALKIFVLALDQLEWADVVDNIRALIVGLDQALEVASLHREQGAAIPISDIISELTEKAQFLGDSVRSVIRNFDMKFRATADFAFILSILTDVDWFKLYHLSEADAERCSIMSMLGDMKFLDFNPTKLEIAMKVSLCSRI